MQKRKEKSLNHIYALLIQKIEIKIVSFYNCLKYKTLPHSLFIYYSQS